MVLPKLVVLPVSPWSERARWALDHHGLPYRAVEHAPFLGERRLRRLVGRRSGPATVPVYIDGDTTLTESWDIVAHADRVGSASKLIPEGREGEVRRWTAIADQSMGAGRALVISAMLRSPAALDEGLPRQIPGWLRPALRPVTWVGTRWFARKYKLRLDDVGSHLPGVRAGLDALRAGLALGSPHLLGSFSYADIVMATLLQGVSPVNDGSMPLQPATRAAWTQAALAAEYPDLIAWRDALYRSHRSPRVPTFGDR